MAGLVEELGQRDVEAGVGLRTGSHGHAETGATSLATIGGDDEGPFAPRLIVRVDIGPAEEDAVLDGDRMEVAGAHADECKRRCRLGVVVDGNAVAVLRRPPQADARWVQEFLPGMRADGVAEKGIIGAALDAVSAAVLDVGPASREVGDTLNIVEEDRLIAEGRPDDAVAAPRQRFDQRLEAAAGQDRFPAARRSRGVFDWHAFPPLRPPP